MAYNYVVTAQKATGVSLSVAGHFTGPQDVNLIVAKCNRIEVHIVTPEGLRPLHDVGIYGKVTNMEIFRPEDADKDFLFVMTERCDVFIVSYRDGHIETKSCGNIQERTFRFSQTGYISLMDPHSKVVCLRIWDGYLNVVMLGALQADDGADARPVSQREIVTYNIRVEDLNIIDIKFLYGCATPTICYIYEDQYRNRHVKTMKVNMVEKELMEGPWKRSNVETESFMIIPVPEPLGGTVIVGQDTLVYLNNDRYCPIAPPVMKESVMMSFCRLDVHRYLLGDASGRLFALLLLRNEVDGETVVTDMRLEELGQVVCAHTLSYVDNGVLFVGSKYGDSQLVRLLTDADENGSFVQVIDTYACLAPICDMAVIDLERQGQGQLVTCSGFGREGSLRVVRSGIGIQEIASLDVEALRGVWALRVNGSQEYDNVVILTFVGQSRVISLAEGELEVMELNGFSSDQETIFAGNVHHDQLLQVTHSFVALLRANSPERLQEWKPPCGRNISVVSCNGQQILLACGAQLYYLEIGDGVLNQISTCTMEHEVACVDISGEDGSRTDVCAVGLWTDITIRLLRLPSLESLLVEPLGGDIIPRSVLKCIFEGQSYLIVSLGDGSVIYFPADFTTGQLGQRKRVILGSQPTTLQPFRASSTRHVFACSDRPTVIYSSSRKLLFSNVNVREVTHICTLHAEAFPNSLAVASENGLTFGTIDEIEKLHIQMVPLGETPRRIAHDEVSSTLGVALDRDSDSAASVMVHAQVTSSETSAGPASSGSRQEGAAAASASALGSSSTHTWGQDKFLDSSLVCSFAVIDQHTFEVLHAHQFGDNELLTSLAVVQFSSESSPFYCVGSSVTLPNEDESHLGYITLFHFNDGKLLKVARKEVKGAVFSLVNFNGKLLASVNNTVGVYEWTEDKELQCECQYAEMVLCIYLKAKGDFILAGDLMRSLTLLVYKPLEGTLEVIAQDYQTMWMTGVDILDDDHFLGAEHFGNLFTCQRDSAATNDEDRKALRIVGRFHLGDSVNVFRRGSLVMKQSSEVAVPISDTLLYGTVHGAVGLIATIPSGTFQLLSRLQRHVAKTIRSVGCIDHTVWRSFWTDCQLESSQGFIDGDLIEMYLELSREDQIAIAAEVEVEDGSGMKQPITVDELTKMVEELARLH